MSVIIENEYEGSLELTEEQINKFEDIIIKVIDEAIDFVDFPYECEVSVTLTDNPGIHSINKRERDIDRPTDVLSFPMLEYSESGNFSFLEETDDVASYFNPDTGELMLGDIVISLDKVYEQAEAYGHSELREIAFLTAHSMLHLFGYDHMEEEERIEMERLQDEILNNLGITRDYV